MGDVTVSGPWLYRVVAPHFVAGFEVHPEDGRVGRVAPILRRALRWPGIRLPRVLDLAKRRAWTVERVA